MAKDIMTVSNNMPAFLKKVQSKVDDYLAGIGGGMPLAVLSVRGKEFRFRKDGHETSTRLRDLEVIFVAARRGVSKRLYKDAYSSGEVKAPDCSSVDGITPDVAQPEADRCAACPNNVWGSIITASGKQGKACQDYKRIVVLPLIGGETLDEPVVLDIPATSMKSPKGFKGNELMFREYMTIMAKHSIPPEGAVTTLSFTDAEYPQLAFSFSRFATEAEYKKVQGMAALPAVAEVLSEAAAEPAGPIKEETPAEPAPAPAPAPKKEKAALKKKAEPAVAVKPEPEPEPEPEQGESEEGSASEDDDLMAELKKILGG